MKVDGSQKITILRNVELTGSFIHNVGMWMLIEVVELFARGGDFDNGDDHADAVDGIG